MSCETELKYQMPETLQVEEVWAHIGRAYSEKILMKSTYFDTKNNLLGFIKASLRHRMENDVSVYTVKTTMSKSGALASRGEWQVEALTLNEALPKLSAIGAPEDVLTLAKEELKTIAEFEFTRHSGIIEGDGFKADLCVDIGYLSPDGIKKAPLREVELELLDGDVDALCAYGEKFAKALNLTPQSLSKLSRARNLK